MRAYGQTGFLRTATMVAALCCAGAIPARGQSEVRVWLSSEDLRYKLSEQPALRLGAGGDRGEQAIRVDVSRRYQKMLGMGSSLEPTTCSNLSKLDPARQDEVIARLFDPGEGIGMNLTRLCIGSPDFTGGPYVSYDDMPPGETDEKLEHFSIEKDREYILPVIKKALKANPKILFFASPWSPPGWMKTTGDMIGGELLPKYYEAYAQYFVRYIEDYQREGIPIYAVTIQNEPGVDNSRKQGAWRYPSCHYTAEQERAFIRHLGPALEKAGLKTHIWSYDHNYNERPTANEAGIDYPTTVLQDPVAARYVAGAAFHHYAGEPSGMSIFHTRFPALPIHFSEGSCFGVRGMAQIMSYLENWATSYNAWVTMIDEKRGPNIGPFPPGDTIVKRNSRDNNVEYRCDYYFYGQLMKFVERGAVRIATTVSEGPVRRIAFVNPDGQVVLAVVNTEKAPAAYRVWYGGRSFPASVPGASVATYRWKR